MPQSVQKLEGVAYDPAGFSLVELLVVTTISGALIAMLLPAVQAARESARRAECRNNAKQLAQASLSHESALGFFPTGGWDKNWLGHPDQGFGKAQPGGWIYNILPFIEQQTLHDLGAMGSGVTIQQANAKRLATPLTGFYCPSRRFAALYRMALSSQFKLTAGFITPVARNDYAMNGGDYRERPDLNRTSPQTLQQGNDPTHLWWKFLNQTGISYQRSQVAMADIGDGASNTFLIGEKYINRDHYTDGCAEGDMYTMYCGYDKSLLRWTGILGQVTDSTGSGNNLPRQDRSTPTAEGDEVQWFGSAHAGGFNMSFCDGSVRTISYSIDGETYRCLGNRKDEEPVDGSRF